MKYLKMLGLAAVAVASLMTFAATASATTLTSPNGTTYTGNLQAESGVLSWDGAFSTITCKNSTLGGTAESHGAATTVGVKLSSLTFTECNFPFTVGKPGSLEIHTEGATANGNGTITWSGMELAMHTSVGTCIFTTSNTHIGTLTGSDVGKAQWDINATKIPRTGGNFLCGSSSTLTGSYTITTPSTLTVD
jgi:hypothetical protein